MHYNRWHASDSRSHMLKGSRQAIVRATRPVSIHGQITLEIVFTDADDSTEQLNAARVGHEAIVGLPLEIGDRIEVEYLVGVVVKVTKISSARQV